MTNGCQFAKFANIFPRHITALYGIQYLRIVGGVVNTLVVMAAAEGSKTLSPNYNDANLNF